MAERNGQGGVTKPEDEGQPKPIVIDPKYDFRGDNSVIAHDAPSSLFRVPPAPAPADPPLGPDDEKSTTDPESPITKKNLKSKQMTSMEQAKDRAQITASTAMSIVQVALLKDVIDAGPTGNKYYYWSLSFILIALILQIVSGFIALYIALLRYYYTEYKDDFIDDCCKTCCPWRIRRVPHSHDTLNDWVGNRPTPVMHKKKKKKTGSSDINIIEDDCDIEAAGCCGPYECTTMRYANFEYKLLDMYDNMAEEIIKSDLQTASCKTDLEWMKGRLNRLKAELKLYEESAITSSAENQAQAQRIRARIMELQTRRDEIEEKNVVAKHLRAQGYVLAHHVELIQEERVLKRATFWQNWLNMMLYTVFVLNAVIAALGLANQNVNVVLVNGNPVQINSTTG